MMRPAVYRTAPHPCSYLPGRTAVTDFFEAPDGCGGLYEALLSERWRRSGGIVYRPACPDCDSCQPIRLPVDRFAPSRSQERTLRRNRDVSVELSQHLDDPEAIGLYGRYQTGWHGAETDPSPEDTVAFLGTSPVETLLMLYRVGERLVGAGWVDLLPEGLSSVYFAFEPAEAKRRLGVFSLMREIELARSLGKSWLYLGYWIPACPTMAYKADYRPHEILSGGAWRPGAEPEEAPVTPPGPGSSAGAGPG